MNFKAQTLIFHTVELPAKTQGHISNYCKIYFRNIKAYRVSGGPQSRSFNEMKLVINIKLKMKFTKKDWPAETISSENSSCYSSL